MRKRIIEKERFQVRDDLGRTHEIVHSIEQIDATTIEDTTTTWIDGLSQLQLSTGGAVNMLSDSDYELVTLGVKATRI